MYLGFRFLSSLSLSGLFSVLTDHLNRLQDQEIIERRGQGRKNVYILTDKGKEREKTKKELIMKNFQIIRGMIIDEYTTAALLDLSKLNKKDPKFVDETLQSIQDLIDILTSDEMLHWIGGHLKGEGIRVLKKELIKKLSKITPQETEEPSIFYI